MIAGFQTEFYIDTTTRQAWSLGYDVTLMKDAHSMFDNAVLTAPQIIAQHSGVLRSFAQVVEAEEMGKPEDQVNLI